MRGKKSPDVALSALAVGCRNDQLSATQKPFLICLFAVWGAPDLTWSLMAWEARG